MAFKHFVKTTLVDRLPTDVRMFVEQQYVGHRLADEKRLFQSLCSPHLTSVDVGANQGDLTLLLSRYSTRVHAFEPVPDMAARLSHRFRDCRVTVHACALGAAQGEGVLRVPAVGSRLLMTRATLRNDLHSIRIYGRQPSHAASVSVPITTLDDCELGSVGFIKIDVEGYECDVLRGAHETIRTHKPALYIEIEQRRHERPIREIFASITAFGYQGWFVHASRLCELVAFDVEKMQSRDREDTSDFINNFVFTPLASL